eukprot:NODE_1210_length_1210_cov_2.869264.p2 GENE.NODE_1210_length_1210_cov_2.869264~~NODE_1210_length_1210_cov_2.869264.p2  ORF type:complete len:126 (+),score=8.99 NODE_1210_length_1210_cov_2.869264:565-942(+)
MHLLSQSRGPHHLGTQDFVCSGIHSDARDGAPQVFIQPPLEYGPGMEPTGRLRKLGASPPHDLFSGLGHVGSTCAVVARLTQSANTGHKAKELCGHEAQELCGHEAQELCGHKAQELCEHEWFKL